MADQQQQKHEGDVRQYSVDDNPRPGDVVATVMFGFYAPKGGTSGEMSVRWREWQSFKAAPSPYLQCWNDGWHALAQFKDVIDALAEVDGQDITLEKFCQILERCGFTKR